MMAAEKKPGKFIPYLKKLGWAGFLFFLIKGLLWLLVPYLASRFF